VNVIRSSDPVRCGPASFNARSGARLADLVAALADGLLSLHVGATFALADAATALQGAVTGRAAGATVLTLEGISSDAADHT
jgi:NADPH:quinone reductase-like Zn-dependent oxidoreductase